MYRFMQLPLSVLGSLNSTKISRKGACIGLHPKENIAMDRVEFSSTLSIPGLLGRHGLTFLTSTRDAEIGIAMTFPELDLVS